MKKIFTLVAATLCAVGVSAQAYQYTLTEADETISQELLDKIAVEAGATDEAKGQAELIIPASVATINVVGIDPETGDPTGVKVPENLSILIKGAEGGRPTLNFIKSLNVAGNHDYIRLENVKLADGGCQYLVNQSTENSIGEFALTNVEAKDFERSLYRTQADNVAQKVDNIIIDNCIFTNMITGNGYSFFYFGTATTEVGKLEIKNSTFNTSQRSFIEASKAPIANGITITDCTFYNNVQDGRYLIDANGQNTAIELTRVILGKSYVETARGMRSAITPTFTDCLRAYDCVYSSNDISLEKSFDDSAAIFTDPDNGNFVLKIDDKVGDPRWYKDGEIATSISKVAAEQVAADAPAYNLAGQKVTKAYKGVVVKNGKKVFQNN